jgi:hypothetical protein
MERSTRAKALACTTLTPSGKILRGVALLGEAAVSGTSSPPTDFAETLARSFAMCQRLPQIHGRTDHVKPSNQQSRCLKSDLEEFSARASLATERREEIEPSFAMLTMEKPRLGTRI